MGGNDLKKAEKLFRRGNYTQVLQLLEAQIFRYRQVYRFYYILGMSCLHTGDYTGAESFLRRALSISPGRTDALLGMAVVHLKQQKTNDALKDWFEVIDQEPKNKYAARGLAAVKKHGDPQRLIAFTESRHIFSLLPGEKSLSPFILVAGSVGILAVAAFLFYPAYADYLPLSVPEAQRPEISELDLSIGEYGSEVSEENDNPAYQFTERELKKNYEKIIEYFNDYEDNLAQREINRIQASNASAELKQKVGLLENYIREPGFDTFSINFPYREVKKEPILYDGCYAIWRGKVSNLVVGSDIIEFDLLVGYESGQVLEGIVPVDMDFAAKVDPAVPVEVLGKIRLDPTGLRMDAVSIHQFIAKKEE